MGAIANGLLALGSAALAVALLASSGAALAKSGAREEFALGSLVGGLGVLLGLAALVVAILAAVCWLIRRRLRRTARARAIDVAFVMGATVPPLAVAALLAGWMLR